MRHLATAGLVLNTPKTVALTTEAHPTSFIHDRDSHMIRVLGYTESHKWLGCVLRRLPWPTVRCGTTFFFFSSLLFPQPSLVQTVLLVGLQANEEHEGQKSRAHAGAYWSGGSRGRGGFGEDLAPVGMMGFNVVEIRWLRREGWPQRGPWLHASGWRSSVQ